jgi:hypothetical protein
VVNLTNEEGNNHGVALVTRVFCELHDHRVCISAPESGSPNGKDWAPDAIDLEVNGIGCRGKGASDVVAEDDSVRVL